MDGIVITPQNFALVPVPMINAPGGTLQASNGATLTLNNGVFDNQGAVRAQTGGDVVYNAQANALNLTTTPGTLIGGIWQADGNGSSISFGALHSNIVTNGADIYLVGAGSSIRPLLVKLPPLAVAVKLRPSWMRREPLLVNSVLSMELPFTLIEEPAPTR